MKSISAKEVFKVLQKHNFFLARHKKGSYSIWKHIVSGKIVIVPVHGGNKQLPIGTLLSIIKQSEIPQSEFSKTKKKRG
ncbi:MAG: type II toxin-antitoxin system HicA family toxin [Patescibacteria group bacterium]